MNETTVLTRTLSEHLHDIGISFEALQHDLAFIFGKSLNEAAGAIVQAWLNNELETLIYESGICD